jgi:hypothetical protein
MKRYSLLLAAATTWLCGQAQAEVFKCTNAEGKVSFASTPCPTYVGQSTLQRGAQSRLSSDWEERDFTHRLNLNATEILQVSRRRKIIITNEKEIADRMQKIRQPPPGVPSVCVAPRFDSICFDPSGGRVRQPVAGGLVQSGAK